MGGNNKYSGLLYCWDCGAKLYFYRKRDEDSKSYSFNCSIYRNNAKVKCSPHRIREVVLDEILLEGIRRIIPREQKSGNLPSMSTKKLLR